MRVRVHEGVTRRSSEYRGGGGVGEKKEGVVFSVSTVVRGRCVVCVTFWVSVHRNNPTKFAESSYTWVHRLPVKPASFKKSGVTQVSYSSPDPPPESLRRTTTSHFLDLTTE